MSTLLRSFLLVLLACSTSAAQVTVRQTAKSHDLTIERSEKARIEGKQDIQFEGKASKLEITVPGANPVGFTHQYGYQTTGRALHNVQVDPSNPDRVHGVFMANPNTTDADSANGTFPNRGVYYVYSSNAGASWTAAKRIGNTRAGYPSMILIQVNGNYVPVIALHRREADVDEYRTALYIESGAPGTGTFVETAANRTLANEIEGDIIWPSIAASPDFDSIYVVASMIRETAQDPFQRMQFTVFTVSPSGSITWSGAWTNGPGDDNTGLESGGDNVIRVSPSGRVGVLWISDDGSNSVYFAESGDGGKTWSGAEFAIYSPVGMNTTDPSTLVPSGGGLDFTYIGETAHGIWTGYAQLANGNYYPSLGALLYWVEGQEVPRTLVSRVNFESDLGVAEYPLDYLGFYGTADGADPITVNPQTANISNAAIARGPGDDWAIFFETWREGDTSEVFIFDTRQTEEGESYTYHGLQVMTTGDGGVTWSEPSIVRGNDLENPEAARQDYRFVNVSDFNPLASGNINYQILYLADTMAGNYYPGSSGGLPVYSNMSYYAERVGVQAGVERTVTPTLSISQNYPNPVASAATIELSFVNPTNAVLTLEDMLGRPVEVLASGVFGTGKHQVAVKAEKLSPGVYQYVLRTESESVARRMVVTK